MKLSQHKYWRVFLLTSSQPWSDRPALKLINASAPHPTGSGAPPVPCSLPSSPVSVLPSEINSKAATNRFLFNRHSNPKRPWSQEASKRITWSHLGGWNTSVQSHQKSGESSGVTPVMRSGAGTAGWRTGLSSVQQVSLTPTVLLNIRFSPKKRFAAFSSPSAWKQSKGDKSNSSPPSFSDSFLYIHICSYIICAHMGHFVCDIHIRHIGG